MSTQKRDNPLFQLPEILQYHDTDYTVPPRRGHYPISAKLRLLKEMNLNIIRKVTIEDTEYLIGKGIIVIDGYLSVVYTTNLLTSKICFLISVGLQDDPVIKSLLTLIKKETFGADVEIFVTRIFPIINYFLPTHNFKDNFVDLEKRKTYYNGLLKELLTDG